MNARFLDRRFCRRIGAAVIFFASMVPFGIAVHLASELAGLGWHDDADVVFSSRHAYLAGIAAAVLAGFVGSLLSIRPCRRRATVAAMIDRLPYGGRGIRFTALSFAIQFAFFAITQVGEGCPLCDGDIFVGVVAAAAAAAAGALLVALGKRRFIALVLAILCIHRARRRSAHAGVLAARRRLPIAVPARAAAFFFRYRPPPLEAD